VPVKVKVALPSLTANIARPSVQAKVVSSNQAPA
jgi:hypothetical protein